jgi:hypothetical protein
MPYCGKIGFFRIRRVLFLFAVCLFKLPLNHTAVLASDPAHPRNTIVGIFGVVPSFPLANKLLLHNTRKRFSLSAIKSFIKSTHKKASKRKKVRIGKRTSGIGFFQNKSITLSKATKSQPGFFF